MASVSRPGTDEYRVEFERYVARVPDADILGALARQGDDWRAFLAAVPPELADFAYAPGKWTVRQVVAHLLDGELVFAYRTLAIARGDTQPLPGFDENEYMARAGGDPASLAELGEEFASLRRSNVLLFRRFDADVWTRRGTASDHPVTVRALAYVMVGHVRHHGVVLAERYGARGVPAS